MTNDKVFARMVASLPLFLSILLAPYLPTQFPMQFASDGSVNYYLPKLWALIVLNSLVVYLTWLYFYRVKKQANLRISHKGLRYLRLAFTPGVAVLIIFYVALDSHYSLTLELGDVIVSLIALIFLIVGNYLPKVEPRPMFFLPFLKKHVVPKRVWRVLGWGMVGSSLLLLLYLQFDTSWLIFGVLLLCVFLPLYAQLSTRSVS